MVPVQPARGVQEQLPVLAPGAVELVVAGAHGVDEVHVASPEPDEGVHSSQAASICCRAWVTDSWSTCAVASRLAGLAYQPSPT